MAEESTEPVSVPRAVALHYQVAPRDVVAGVIDLVAHHELSPAALREIEQLAGVRVRVVDVSPERFRIRFTELYGVGAAAIAEEKPPSPGPEPPTPPEAGIVRFVDELLREALHRRATDVHLEPSSEGLGVRLRIDGLLSPLPVPHDLARHGRRIAARMKVLAGMDSTPSPTPREGMIRWEDRHLRVSVLPTAHGEAIHVRVLPLSHEFPTLDDLGAPPPVREEMARLMSLPSGLVVACGPTGSGKSTTLHVMLRTGVPDSKKIITVEDPVEFWIPGAVQVEVTPHLSFARALRSILRHDPDVILVGEMRDRESAEIAMQAALTGHLVLTSLHTDDEAQAITRLLQLGMAPTLLAAALRAVIAQRLVRRVCLGCRGASGAPCLECGGTGYRGRIGLFQVTVVRGPLVRAVEQGLPEATLRTQIRADSSTSLGEQGRELVRQGITTEFELARVLGTSTP